MPTLALLLELQGDNSHWVKGKSREKSECTQLRENSHLTPEDTSDSPLGLTQNMQTTKNSPDIE